MQCRFFTGTLVARQHLRRRMVCGVSRNTSDGTCITTTLPPVAKLEKEIPTPRLSIHKLTIKMCSVSGLGIELLYKRRTKNCKDCKGPLLHRFLGVDALKRDQHSIENYVSQTNDVMGIIRIPYP